MVTPNKVAQKASAEEAKNEPRKKTSIPDSAPRPQDHRPAKADVKRLNDEVNGFEYDDEFYEFVEDVEGILEDVDFLEQLQDGNVIGSMRRIIGLEAWYKMKEKYRDEDGKLKITPNISGAFEQAMKVVRAKNS